jgi:long-chain fatty acid transport protein
MGSSGMVAGNGFRLVSQDALAAARGEAFAATADNPSAVHYNPAGITQLAGHQLRTGFYGLYFDPTYRRPSGGTTYGIEENDAVAPQFYYTYGAEDSPITFGLGVYSPHGAAVEWPQDTGFRTVATEGELTYIRFNPVVAFELAPGLSIGGGIMIDYADIALEQGLPNLIPSIPNFFRFEGDDLAAGFNLGLLWQPNEKLSLGATLRSGSDFKFSGRTSYRFFPAVPDPDRRDATAEFDFPVTAVFGISYRPNRDWNFEFNADWTQWSSIDTTTIRQDPAPPDPFLRDVPVQLEWKDSWMLKFGATRYLPDGWRVSAGYVFNENSVPDDYYSPVVADLDRHIFSLGVGRDWGNCTLDVTYQFGYGPDREVTGSENPVGPLTGTTPPRAADGTYDFLSHGLLVSFGKRF